MWYALWCTAAHGVYVRDNARMAAGHEEVRDLWYQEAVIAVDLAGHVHYRSRH